MTETRPPTYLTEKFLKFARTETHGSSPLYALLAERAAADPELGDLAAEALPGQHEPLMLFAAVHYLLLTGFEHPLAEYYATCTPAPRRPDDEAYRRLGSFCQLFRDELAVIIATRRAQTNEVNRSTSLLPAFCFVAEHLAGRMVELTEVGSSAGLNLNWDRYSYDYGEGRTIPALRNPGPDLELVLATELRGPLLPPLDAAARLRIADRRGIDLHPIDLTRSENAIWLQALVWPEHLDRMRRLEKAARIARRFPPAVRIGDAETDLLQIVRSTSNDRAPVIFHSFVLYQMPEDRRDRLAEQLREASAGRIVYRVSLEWFGTETPLLDIDIFSDGGHEHVVLAATDPHGRWLEWLAVGQ
jgi:hypothetical protein